jgi:zinc protease
MRRLVALALVAAGAIAQTRPAARPAVAPKPASAPPGRTSAAAAKPAPVPSYTDLKFPPLGPIQIPQVATFTLANGMKLYLLEDHELPVVSGTALVRTGNLFDPPDKVGLATVTGMVIRTGGTRSRTGDQLDEQLENVAAAVESNIGETSGSVRFTAMKANTGEVLGIFKDVLTAPAFRQDRIDLAKSQMRSSISRRNDSPGGIAQREFLNTIYGRNTPYGWQEEYATIDRITRDDIRNFYQRYFFPANIMLAVFGDFDTAEMKAGLEKLFADFTVEQQPVPPFPEVGPAPPGGVFLVVKTDVAQTFFAMGQRGGELRDPDYPALETMSDILGGGFQSRLFQRVRTKMGNAYDIGAGWDAGYDHPGTFLIAGSTKSLSTVETLKAIREEVDRIRTAEVTEAELKTAKDTVLNSLVFAFDTKAKTLNRMLTYEYYGYPRDFIQQYQKALAAVTRADVLRVAKKRLDPEKFVTIAVGNPQDFGTPLDALGVPVKPLDIAIPPPRPEAAPASKSGLEQGRKLMARAQEAVGGAGRLAAVKDCTIVSQYRLSANDALVKETDRWLAPGIIREEGEGPGQKMSAYWDGKVGWYASFRSWTPLAGAQLKSVQGDLFRVYFPFLLSDRTEGRTVNAIGEHTVEISDQAGNIVQLEIDAESGLPSRLLYQSSPVQGPPQTMQEDYADFREVNGIRMPHQVTILHGGRKYADVRVDEVRLNTGLRIEDLRRRP